MRARTHTHARARVCVCIHTLDDANIAKGSVCTVTQKLAEVFTNIPTKGQTSKSRLQTQSTGCHLNESTPIRHLVPTKTTLPILRFLDPDTKKILTLNFDFIRNGLLRIYCKNTA